MDKALELWKRFIKDDTPWTDDCYGDDVSCFFCGTYYPNHSDDCIWIEAKKLVEENK